MPDATHSQHPNPSMRPNVLFCERKALSQKGSDTLLEIAPISIRGGEPGFMIY